MDFNDRIAKLEKRARVYRNCSVLLVAAIAMMVVVGATQDSNSQKVIELKGIKIVDADGHVSLEIGPQKGKRGVIRAFAPKSKKPGIVCEFDTAGAASLAVLSKNTGNIVAGIGEDVVGDGYLKVSNSAMKGGVLVSADPQGGVIEIVNTESKLAAKLCVTKETNITVPGAGFLGLWDRSSKSAMFMAIGKTGAGMQFLNHDGNKTVVLDTDDKSNGRLTIADFSGKKGRSIHPW